MHRRGTSDILSPTYPVHSHFWPSSLPSSFWSYPFPSFWGQFHPHERNRFSYRSRSKYSTSHPPHPRLLRRRWVPRAGCFRRHAFDVIWFSLGGLTASIIYFSKRYVAALDEERASGINNLQRPSKFDHACMQLSWRHFKKHRVVDKEMLEQDFFDERKRLNEFGEYRLQKIDPTTRPSRSRCWS
ncbi:uncharacterized protein EI90DRAFT_3038741 [Cantharellus anzutake]|uniref:uncharacterized protein n=1 Tax=Cantharellus anzutake TaxID=1750568 RepID=UPI001905D6C7|nr:uncharacterized protein EI90DRAFT_3038741 [Cantharellus anzutake]KAF8339997.1 hypothetical protein EI90DRAFT_3038741 [Cantharellus anzutake]